MSENTPEYSSDRPGKKEDTDIRYVPVEYLSGMQNEDDDEIDLLDLVRSIWKNRGLIIKTTGIFIILGLFVALGSSEEYTSNVRLLPETQQTSTLGSLSGIARQFGISTSGNSSVEEGIPTTLYPELAKNVIVMERLLDYEVNVENLDQPVTLYDYFTEYNSPSIVSVVSNYTIRLPFTIIGGIRQLFRNEPTVVLTEPDVVENREFIRLSQMQWQVVYLLQNRISAQVDETTGVISVSVQMPEPQIATQVAGYVVDLLSEFIIGYRTEKTRDDLSFIETLTDNAKYRFEQAQDSLARFRDENPGQLTARAGIREQHLQNQYNITFNLYNTMLERLEETRIKLQEETPVLNVLTPAIYPDLRSSPKRTRILVIYTLAGAVLGVGLVFGKQFWGVFWDKMNEAEAPESNSVRQ